MHMHTQTHVYLGEVHLKSPPQDESSWGKDMCNYTEQHQKDGHRHHYHIMTNAARDKKKKTCLTCSCVSPSITDAIKWVSKRSHKEVGGTV